MAITAVELISLSSEFTGTGDSGDPITLVDNQVNGSRLASGTVNFVKLQDIATDRLIGRSAAGSGSPEELTIGTGLQLSGGELSATGGGGGGTNTATLTADTTTMFITYEGASVPTLVEDTPGNYTLTEPTGTIIRGFDWIGNNGDTDPSGDLILVVDSIDNDDRFLVVQVINRGNNQIADLPSLGVNVEQVSSPAGTMTMTMTSMSGFGASGWRVMARPA